MIVLDDQTCMVKYAQRISWFYQHESCGWCIPCREGTAWLKKILESPLDIKEIKPVIPKGNQP